MVEEWLKEFDSEATKQQYMRHFEEYLRFHNTTAEELVKGFQEAPDKHLWSKEHGTKLIQFQMDLREQGKKTNSARMATIGPRSFYASQCMKVIVKRGAIPTIKPAMGEHEFTAQELRKELKGGKQYRFYVKDKVYPKPEVKAETAKT